MVRTSVCLPPTRPELVYDMNVHVAVRPSECNPFVSYFRQWNETAIGNRLHDLFWVGRVDETMSMQAKDVLVEWLEVAAPLQYYQSGVFTRVLLASIICQVWISLLLLPYS